MNGERINFAAADAAEFNALRDRWRETATGFKLAKPGLLVASLLPTYVNRELGYAFPTDLQLATIANTTEKTISRGMAALETAGLIERETMIKRDEKKEAKGKLRRIFLTLPTDHPQVTGQVEVTGQEVTGHPEVNGQNEAGEWTDAVRISLIKHTLDNEELAGKDSEVVHSAPARDGHAGVYAGDDQFLDAFDRLAITLLAGRQIAAGQLEAITEEAFDKATASDPLFMPFGWQSVTRLHSRQTRDWFLRRTGQIIHGVSMRVA